LKLFVSPLRRRSELVRRRPRNFLSKGRRHSYLVRMIKPKPDRISRLARSTNLSKILKSGPPERCPWDRGPEFYLKVSSNLMRSANFCTRLFLSGCIHRRFCANFSKISKFDL
jgi:hypothetical protein